MVAYPTSLPLCVGIFFFLSILLLPPPCSADCTCSTGSNGVTVVGFELIAKQCPEPPYSETRTYTYLVNPLRCDGTSLLQYSSYGDMTGSPQSLSNFFINSGYRVLRNASGTHLVAVQRGTYPFSGIVSGVNMTTAPQGVYYSEPVGSMDQYCTAQPLPDQDQNGIPDCLDITLPLNLGNPLCAIPVKPIY